MGITRRAQPAGRARAAAVLLAVSVLTTSCSFAGAALGGVQRGVEVPHRVGDVAARPLGSPALAPVGEGGYAFADTHADGRPVTFDPCRELHYVIRPDGEPAGGAEMLRAVIEDVSVATGLRFVDDGLTDEAPTETRKPYQPQRYGDRWAPVLVAWSDATESPELAGRVLGRAGPDVFRKADGSDARFVSGMAVFNGPEIGRLLAGGLEARARAVLLHEMGHLVGLGHVADPYQVMFDTNVNPLDKYAAGDLRGLEQLGLGRCYRDY